MWASGSRTLQLFPNGPPTAHQSSPQVSRPRQLDDWGGTEETWVGFPSCSPSLPLWCRDRGRSWPGLTSLFPAPAATKSQLQPLPPRAPCPGPCAQACPPLALGQEVPPEPLRQRGRPAWGRMGCRADTGASWPTGQRLLLSSPQRHPSGDPCLPSPTAFWNFFCFSTPSTTKGPSLCTSLLAGGVFGHQGRPGGEWLCCNG